MSTELLYISISLNHIGDVVHQAVHVWYDIHFLKSLAITSQRKRVIQSLACGLYIMHSLQVYVTAYDNNTRHMGFIEKIAITAGIIVMTFELAPDQI